MNPKRKSASEQDMADITHIKDLKPDQRNARKHNARNIGMIEDALNEVGAARSIVIDEDGRILAGNGTVEAAAQAGIERVKVVEASGEEIVAVRRRGLTEKQKRRLALFDNRTAELAEWERDEISAIANESREALEGLFHDNEVQIFMTKPKVKPLAVKDIPDMAWLLIGVPLDKWQKVASFAESASRIENAIVETTVGDNK